MRKYGGSADRIHGGSITPQPILHRGPKDCEPVTAIDERDVAPLVEALKEIAGMDSVQPGADGLGPVILMRDDEMRGVADAALQSYEKEAQDG